MITFTQISGNVARIALETEKEQKALDRLLERKVKDPDTGLTVPITVAWANDQGVGCIPAGLVPYLIDNLSGKFKVDNQMNSEDDTFFPVTPECFVNVDPRDYQIDACKRLLAFCRGILQGVTGAGKTAMLGAIIHAILRAQPTWRFMVIGFTVDHWQQVQKSLKTMNIPCQEVGKGVPSAPVAVGRFDAFERNIAKAGPWNNFLRTAEVVMFDEVRHLGTAATYINFARAINPLRSYGFDGTPLRNYQNDGDPYELWEDMQTIGYCGPIRIRIGYKELQRLGYLPLTYVHFLSMPLPPKIMGGLPRDIPITSDFTRIYKHLVVENDYRTSRFARLITNLAGGGKIIAMVKQHEHARRLMKMLLDNDIESLAWLGDKKALAVSPGRGVYDAPFTTTEVRRRFMETPLPVVVGSSVLSEAISLDCATDAVNLAAGKQFSLSGQRAGRIMRRDQGRTPVCHYWDADDHGNRIMQAQSNARRKHFQAVGLDVIDIPCPEALFNLRKIGLRTSHFSIL